MDTFYEDIYWDSAKEWYITEEKDHVTGIPVIINESKEAIIFILNNPPQNGEIPETITIKDDSNIPLNKDIDGEYIVTEVYLNCKKWGNLRLPKNVKRIIIDRNPLGHTGRYDFGTCEDSWFSIEDSKYLKTDYYGSVYSKDGKILYHYHSSEDNPLGEELEEILPGSIYYPKALMNLKIPCNVKKLSKGAISGSFSEIDFTGGLNEIESQAFNRIECDNIRINGLISDINEEGVKELERSKNDHTKKNFSLLAPKPQGGRLHNNGDIEFTGYLELQEKINKHKDWDPLLIRSAIKKDFYECADEDISVFIKSIIRERNLYSKIEATQIDVRCNTFKERKSYIVHEPLKEVEELLMTNTKYIVHTE